MHGPLPNGLFHERLIGLATLTHIQDHISPLCMVIVLITVDMQRM